MRNPSYEQALKKCGVKFDYFDDIPVSEINHTRGKQLQGRLEPIDMALVDEYRKMLDEGFIPPPLLLWKPGKGMWVPLDGNQRMAAILGMPKKTQPKTISAYVVCTDDQMVVDRLAWQFNNLVNGRRLSYDECMAHAMTFVRKYGQPIAATAKDWGVKVWELDAKVSEANLRDKAMKHKVDARNVPSSTINALKPLERLGEDILITAIRVVAEAGVGCEDAKKLAAAVGTARNSDDKMKIVKDFASSEKFLQSKAETKGGRVMSRLKPRDQLQRTLSQICGLVQRFEDAALRPAGEADQKVYRHEALIVVNRLIDIYSLGAKVLGQGV